MLKFLLFILLIGVNLSMNAYEEGYADNNGIKIFYRDYGPIEAEPILLVQGLGGQLTFWPDHLIKFLQENNLLFLLWQRSKLSL